MAVTVASHTRRRPLRLVFAAVNRRVPVLPRGLAALAFVGTLIATRHGPGLSPDAVTYISAARNLAAGHG
jgi:hypothetical protein